MKKLCFGILSLGTALSYADVKPANWLSPVRCGHPNKGEQVCLLQNAKTSNFYLSIRRPNQPESSVVIRVESLPVAQVIGANREVYEGMGPNYSGRHAVESTYRLELSTPVVPNPKTTATLEVDGASHGTGYKNFEVYVPVVPSGNQP